MYGQYIKVQSKYLFSNLGLERCRVLSYITSTPTSGVYTKFMQITNIIFILFFLEMNSNETNSCSPTWTLWAYFLCPKFTSFRNCVDIMSIFNREKTGEGSVFFTAGARKIMMESDDNFVMRTPLSPCRYYGGLTGILGSALSLRRVPLFPALLWKSGTSLKYRNIVSCVFLPTA